MPIQVFSLVSPVLTIEWQSVPHGFQWLLQQRKAKDHWVSRKFFARKQRLATVVKELLGGRAYASVADKINKLPI